MRTLEKYLIDDKKAKIDGVDDSTLIQERQSRKINQDTSLCELAPQGLIIREFSAST